MSTTAQYASSPIANGARIATANTNRDGTGTLGTVFAPGANGGRVDEVTIVATATTTAGMVRLYRHDGTNVRLWKEVPVSAVTPSGTVQAFTATIIATLILGPNESLRASTHNAESFDVHVSVGGGF
ncbi:hypothetical protein [Acidovorax sp. K2F]|jgi:hypothetical protein|uniref:hypothetical protein n=1 Tax=Acidovorax sp. K2F TaxID=2978125 RepID=UPI0021B132F6|nr:hypothetical protein [Acidovorax sp. K2F]MCT6721745.1 hypothetical protein [Acidovorax sp. K2F]